MKKMNFWLRNNWKQGLLVLLVVVIMVGVTQMKKKEPVLNENVESKTEIMEERLFEYKGKDGVDALTLLKEKAEVEEDSVGMVVSVNGIQADFEKREFWGFYVNGEISQVGAADYETKDIDVIDWRIENY
jgi:hypothetical protein